jgi:anti-sigma regulatory factor (Ser/Thr protein kinase)
VEREMQARPSLKNLIRPVDLHAVISSSRATRGIVLSNGAPSEARAWLLGALAQVGDTEIEPDVAAQALILVSELVADAVDHGSDEATIRLSIDDETVCIELYDGPRRSLIELSGRDEGVPTLRRRIFRRLADGWSSEEIGDGHLAWCEIRRHPPPSSTDDRS